MDTLTQTKRITLATFKKFIRDNKNNLFIMVQSSFDGMVDCISNVKDIPHKVEVPDVYDNKNTLGIEGVWLVGSSRDYFKAFEDDMFNGIEVSNSCGCFKVGIIKHTN